MNIEGYFIDTNVLFDAICPKRRFHSNFQKFRSVLNKQLSVLNVTNIEAMEISTKSSQLFVKIFRNFMKDKDWDNLGTKKKEELLDELEDKIINDKELREEENKTDFIIDAFNDIKNDLLSFQKESEMFDLCNNFLNLYTRFQQERVNSNFNIFAPDSSNENYNLCKSELNSLNDKSNSFKKTEDKDFDMWSDLIVLLIVGNRDINNIITSFTEIIFYSNDDKFSKNTSKFREYLENIIDANSTITKVKNVILKLNMTKPYTLR